jgi:hypothetical protein
MGVLSFRDPGSGLDAQWMDGEERRQKPPATHSPSTVGAQKKQKRRPVIVRMGLFADMRMRAQLILAPGIASRCTHVASSLMCAST